MDRITFEGNFCDIAMCRESPCPYNGMCSQRETWERLKKYEDAEQHGRLVVLPCKVGDKLYRVFDGNISEHEVRNMKYFARQGRLGIDMTPFFPDAGKSIGKTVFLTREEAEAALEGGDLPENRTD